MDIDYTKFRDSLKQLELQYENYISLDDSLPVLIQEGMRESVIHRFETCYDSLRKALMRYLRDELGIDDISSSPKQLVRIANDEKLLSNSIDEWFKYIDARIGTTHDYDEDKAIYALDVIPDFIDDAIGLYQTMTGKTWE